MRRSCALAIGAWALSAAPVLCLPFTVSIEPQPATSTDNLELVISGSGAQVLFSPVELSTGTVVATLIFASGTVPPTPFTIRLPIGALPPGDYLGRVVDGEADLETIGEAAFSVQPGAGTTAVCFPSDHTLCLRGPRFSAAATLDDPGLVQHWGQPQVRRLSYEGGAFYFFLSSNPELFVKVLDGCGLNGHFWLYVTGLTDLGVSLRIRDTETGVTRTITNDQGHAFTPVEDVNAFPCSHENVAGRAGEARSRH